MQPCCVGGGGRPSDSGCRTRVQTTGSCSGPMVGVVERPGKRWPSGILRPGGPGSAHQSVGAGLDQLLRPVLPVQVSPSSSAI